MIKEKYITYLQENGYKCTPQRTVLLSYFCQHKNKLISVNTMMNYLKKDNRHISLDTIYRNLSLFVAIGLLKSTTLNGKRLFSLKNNLDHQHMFICTECRTTKPLNFCPMGIVQSSLNDCSIKSHKFEVYGLCPSCSWCK
ncbi:Fur family transcriptional regulator [Priestia megaterium]|jgi:Fur family zinc uptake transcriptional regulator|uniref:Fur family transcriptional regulator n=1 Tax=Priestia megaterium TaxID=1404 RepID=UPI0009C03407|nr:transcriptional repressor [Priestia megaterium]USL27828.1 transcriptional repressor [Priestia megaterium]WDM31797.1 transcriptional repressor [Priestia megaterium]